MEEKAQTLTDRQQHWLAHIKASESAGLSLSSYASREGFHVGAIYAAKKTLIKKGVLLAAPGSRFQRVQTETVTSDNNWRIGLPNGVSVSFSGCADACVLSMVLTTAADLE